jgi:putative membrane protein
MIKRFLSCGLGLALALAGAMAPANAQFFDGGATVAPDANIANSDVRWMAKAMRAGIAGVEAGKLAAAQAKRDEVRAFGKTMVEQDGQANDELNALAARKRVLLPSQVDGAQLKMLARLAPMSGDEFDKEYIRTAGLDDQIDAAKLYEDGMANLKDPDLKAYAQKTLPGIKRHFEMAREMNPEVSDTKPVR